MEKKKIIYFHGFGSSGASGTVETLRNLLPDAEIMRYVKMNIRIW